MPGSRTLCVCLMPTVTFFFYIMYVPVCYFVGIAGSDAVFLTNFQIIEVDIPQFLFEEQGRHLYGAKLLELQVKS